MTSPAECHFCARIANLHNELAHEVVWQFPTSVAFLGAHQFYRGYCVLVSRTHATELSRLSEDELPSFLAEMCTLAQAIELAFQPRKLNYELLGNQVPHLHWHLFPRSENDPDTLRPVWFNLDRIGSDPAARAMLEGEAGERPEITRLLRLQLETLQAPTA